MKLPASLLALSAALSLNASAAPGLIGEYFKLHDKLGDEFEVPVGQQPWLVRVDNAVNFAEVKGEFNGSKLTDNFMVRWSGAITIKKAGDQKTAHV